MSTPRLIVLYGAKEVGKTALVNNLMKKEFEEAYHASTNGLVKAHKEASGELLNFFDLPGYRNASDIKSKFIASVKNFSGGLLVFSVNNRQQFEELPAVLTELREHVKGPIFLVGNKADLTAVDRVTVNEANEFAAEHDISYVEISVKTNFGVDNLFAEFVAAMERYNAPVDAVGKNKVVFSSEESDSEDEEEAAGMAALRAELATALPAQRSELERLMSNRDLRTRASRILMHGELERLIESFDGPGDTTAFTDVGDMELSNGVSVSEPSAPAMVSKPEDNATPEKTADPLLKPLIDDIKERLAKVGKSRKGMVDTLLTSCDAATKIDEAIVALKTCGDAAQKHHEAKSGSRWFGKGSLFFKQSATKRKTDELIAKYNPEPRM